MTYRFNLNSSDGDNGSDKVIYQQKPVSVSVYANHKRSWINLTLCYFLVAFAIYMTSMAVMASGKQSNDTVPMAIDELKAVGQGEMQWLFISLYQAKLYSVDGQYKAKSYPHALDITYEVDIDKEDLVSATQDQWGKLSFEGQKYQRWLGQLSSIWPDIKSGDKLTFVVTDNSHSQFYHNGELLASLEQPGFADAFLAIWLSPNTSRPALRKQLLGINRSKQ
ncbi:chalcone isomerase family protein [Motilimonas pumila]|uniref:Chalcone isomerase domain-containing protein n=1 Tax=Motilimonas pumila TaxID=2303987 RepID=A0A418YFP9_9GAMM|nr:chalcone isomerase family protein [Motilimonas pumila]RJG48139.1 hypothetical protein D1Z90_08685 [Motilimonas pumila]